MWADSKNWFLKIGSMVQKLFDVEKLHMRHFLYIIILARMAHMQFFNNEYIF